MGVQIPPLLPTDIQGRILCWCPISNPIGFPYGIFCIIKYVDLGFAHPPKYMSRSPICVKDMVTQMGSNSNSPVPTTEYVWVVLLTLWVSEANIQYNVNHCRGHIFPQQTRLSFARMATIFVFSQFIVNTNMEFQEEI